jgi:hypothetical protein
MRAMNGGPRRFRSLALAAAALLATGAAGQSPDPDGTQPARVHVTVDHIRPVLGFAVNAHHISDLLLYLESVDRIAELGANALIVVSPMYQARVDSSEVRLVPSRCATDAQLVAILKRGRERGLYTALLPIVLIERAGPKEWRGVIEPDDWDQWWSSYDELIDRFLSVAVVADVDLLSIGSELNSTEAQTDRWHRITARVREA